jgi:hypothetical protein
MWKHTKGIIEGLHLIHATHLSLWMNSTQLVSSLRDEACVGEIQSHRPPLAACRREFVVTTLVVQKATEVATTNENRVFLRQPARTTLRSRERTRHLCGILQSFPVCDYNYTMRQSICQVAITLIINIIN